MALTVEDGTGITGADSYVSLADARTRAALLGVSISSTDATAEQQLQQATIYVDMVYRARMQGDKLEGTQARQYPRYPVYIDGFLQSRNDIPQELIDAEIYAAALLESGITLISTNHDGKEVIAEEVGRGAVKVQYSASGKTGDQLVFNQIEYVLQPLLNGNSKYTYRILH